MKRHHPIQVLIIDDSAVVRQVLSGLLQAEGDIEVATAADPVIALSKLNRRRPDVIVLDIEMPRMDGLTFLEQLRKTDRIPVVICSGHVDNDSDRALRALQLGATEIVSKPRIGIQQFLQESRVLIADAVRAASQVRRRRPGSTQGPPESARSSIGSTPQRIAPPQMGVQRVEPRARPVGPSLRQRAGHASAGLRATTHGVQIVAIGASTGGPQALEHLFEQLPEDTPGVVVVQHMPEGFTRAFADRLDRRCRVSVREAKNGDLVSAGQVLVAPGNHHLLVRRQGTELCVDVTAGPLVSRHRPSVNVLFRSVAAAAGSRAIGVLMTGMGDDGAEGLLEMRQARAHTIAQDQESSIVFGMPKAAIDCGAATEVVGLDDLAGRVIERAQHNSPPVAPSLGRPVTGAH